MSESNKIELGRMPSKEEIKHVVFSFYPFKAPRPNDLHPYLYQQYWNIVLQYVLYFCHKTLQEPRVEESINTTHVCLIPKCPGPNPLQITNQ